MAWGSFGVATSSRSRSVSPQPGSAVRRRTDACKLEDRRTASRSASPRPGGSHLRTATPEPARIARSAKLSSAPKRENHFATKSRGSLPQLDSRRGASRELAFNRSQSPLSGRSGALPRSPLGQRPSAPRNEARAASSSPCPSHGSRSGRGASVGQDARRGLLTLPERRQTSQWDAQIRNEIRDLRGFESRLHWEMLRQAKQDKFAEEKVSSADLLQYRWRLQDETRTDIRDKARADTLKVHDENKSRIEFRRERKQGEKEKDFNHLSEQLVYATAQSLAQKELTRMAELRDKEIDAERRDSTMHLAKARLAQRLEEKVFENSERAHELRIEQARQVQELSKQRDELLHRVELARAAHGGAPKPILMASRPATRSVSPMSKRSALRSPQPTQQALKQ